MRHSTIVFSVCLATLFFIASPTLAETQQKKNKSAQKKKSQKPRRKKTPTRQPLTEKQEEAALAFAEKHHPELAQLLMRLKKNRKNQYRRAVFQLFTTGERLGRTKERAPERFEQLLENWKLDSRIRLLMARNAVGGDDELQKKIRELVEQKIELRLHQLKSDRERLKNRLEKIAELIEEIESNPESAIQKEMNRLKKSLGQRKSRKRKKKKEAE